MSDYLWDKSGEPDPEIERLEKLLAPLALPHQRVIALPRPRRWIPLAVAASFLILVAGSWLALRGNRPAWQVSGTPAIKQLRRGESIITNAASRATLALESVGQIEIEPDSQVSVLALTDKEQRLNLNHGKITAMIWAPPGHFFVNTPSVVAVDLGCAYTLEVDATGASLVKVTAGWVAFESSGQESFIPATAVSRTEKGNAPGIPFYEDSPAALQSAVARGDIPEILTAARPRDAITVWHLLRRVPAGQRGQVFDRMSQLIAVPSEITREGVVRGDPAMIDRLWDSVGLGNTAWWRLWKHVY